MNRVQTEDFDVSAEIKNLVKQRSDIGAVVTFSGLVRDVTLTLEHYAGMTERELTKIEAEANARWDLQAVTIIHRVGTLAPADNIVLVITAAAHRKDAFEAAEFLMDYLKTRAPLWKREGDTWVEAKSSDDDAAERWK
ncbi:MAG: molybdenum cofactor biosynthesis protein MoaE [Pseudomonadota bacterium]